MWSPVWIVLKKLDDSGKEKCRVVIDYRKLNEQTIDDKYPLTNIVDLLGQIAKKKYFCISNRDSSQGYS